MTISVIVTCHNEAAFIERALRSVVSQIDYDLIGEIFVVNDGSSDDSHLVLERLASEIPKLAIISTPGIGVSAARNQALAAASGAYIAFLDGDDYWVPEKTRKQMAALEAFPNAGLVYSDFHDFVDFDDDEAQLVTVRAFQASDCETLARYFLHDAPIIPSSTIIRREVFESVGDFDPEMRIGEDTEMFLRVAEKWTFQHVRGGLAFKRHHGKNLTHRLDRLLPVAEMLTRRFVGRNPDLMPLAARRMARRHGSVANACAKQGERRRALAHLLAALKLDPFYGRLYAYFFVGLVPASLGIALRRHGRALYQRIAGHGAAQ